MADMVWRLTALLAISAISFAQAPQRPGVTTLALMHVTLIDGTGAPPKPDVTIVIAGYRIVAIGKSNTVPVPRHAKTVDATGSFVVPGLWDMHAHTDDPGLWSSNPPLKDKESLLTLLIANGVTGIRDMGGDLKLLQEWRSRVGGGDLIGPHAYACGPVLDGAKPPPPGSLAIMNEEQARQAVRDLNKQRADFVAVSSLLAREAYFAIADEAKKSKLPFAGDVPDSLTPAEASDAGQASEEHLSQILESCSDRDGLKKKMDELKDASANERRRAYIETMLATYDEKKAEVLFSKFVKNNTWITPTLIKFQNDTSFEDGFVPYADRMKYVPRFVREAWEAKRSARLKEWTPERLTAEKKLVRKYMELILAMKRAGVKLMVGSDFGGNLLAFPGWGVHDEMTLLVKAGLTPMEAIQAATRNPASFLGLDKSTGTVEVGKLADLGVLNGNPLEDINNTRKINVVIFQGKMYDRAALNRMLSSVEPLEPKK